MDLSYRWLQRYVHVEADPEALAEQLTMAGLEVDGVTAFGSDLDGVVVGHVQDVREHPNADRLVLCDVDLGEGDPVQIACGAPNVAPGQKAPVATVGTTLHLPDRDDPDARVPVTIEARTIRGEASHGMICAEDELGLSDDHTGIMVLPDDAPVGADFAAYLHEHDVQPDDAVLDIDLTPNRPDATSHIGVARDVAALTGGTVCRPEVDLPEAGGEAAERISVTLDDPEGCPRYVAMVVEDVEVGPSPLWLRRRLSAIGLRPKNTLVDITNYVMHECGQPLHAFDLDALAGNQIRVRSTGAEETFTTLDGEERTLPADTLMIADGERDVAVAGVMGGANSEVSESTTNVLIESAYFDPSTIRRTAKALGLQTDSSYRFERGIDRDGQVWAAARAAQLMADLAGGRIVPGMVDAEAEPAPVHTVSLRLSRLAQVLGLSIPADRATELLEAIGFDVESGDGVLHCTVPTWRPDVSIEEDLIEEVARLHGYDEIPEPDKVPIPNVTPVQNEDETLRRRTRQALKGLGYREIYTNSMLRLDRAERFNVPLPDAADTPVVETQNPISQEMAALRPSLLPGALEVMQFNSNHGQDALRVFECGHVFRRAADGDDSLVPGYAEHQSLLIALSGPHAPTRWDEDPREADFFDLKGTVEALLDDLQVPDVTMTPEAAPSGETNGQTPVLAQALTVATGETPIGRIAQVDDDVAAGFDLEQPVFAASLNWDALSARATAAERTGYRPVSRFPTVERDLAVVVNAGQPVGPLQATIRETGRPLLKAVEVFDVYRGEGIDDDAKSVAFTLRFGTNRTLTDAEVDTAMNTILKALKTSFGAELR